RHTRSKRDWSSDVCSSDLVAQLAEAALARVVGAAEQLPLSIGRQHRGDLLGGERLDVARPQRLREVRGEEAEALFADARAGERRSEERRVGKGCRTGGSRD